MRNMKHYLNKPEILIIFVYMISFGTGLFSVFTEVDTLTLLERFPDFCIFKQLTGFKSPGCGMTHAFISLGRFQIKEAFQYNIFSIFLFYGGLLWLTPLKYLKYQLNDKIIFALFAIVIFYWIARNTNLIS